MVSEHSRILVDHLRTLAEAAQNRDASDQELVRAFAADNDAAAFGALVRRHGGMVMGLCRRVLGNQQDAEDAYQATFLVLARKARKLHARELVGNWLYGVALRTAKKARVARTRRTGHEDAAAAPVPRDPVTELTIQEAQSVVDHELAMLPAKFRAPLVLCCLEGLARDEAAKQLNWPVNLVKSRLEQGRELLRRRLTSRGLTLPAGLLSVGLLGTAAQAVQPALVSATVKGGMVYASGGPMAGLVSSRVLTWSDAMLRVMFWSTVKTWALAALTVVLVVGLAAGTFAAMHETPDQSGVQVGQQNPATEKPVQPTGKSGQDLGLKGDILGKWGGAEVLFVAKLDGVVAGPVGLSQPPVYTHTLNFTVEKSLRSPFNKGDKVTGTNVIRQEKEPTFPAGECVVALKKVKNDWRVVAVDLATPELVRQVELIAGVPVGWSMEKDALLSPWAVLGKNAWPTSEKGKGPLVCRETGRPALLVGQGIAFTVEAVPPAVSVQYANPDGDGEYKITVKNTTDKPKLVAALLSDGKKILWEECLVILCQGKTYMAPGAQGVKEPAKATVLKPGESVSTVVNILKLVGPDWPRGGYRIEFQFALGEKSSTESFYYLSRHHDPLREKLSKQ
jgi:RNA polymerase sigma factor (sigma-70 family)